MGVSKVIYAGETLIDLTTDTVKADKILKSYTAHGADGEVITGTCDFDSNTQDATVSDSEILVGKTAYVKGSKITGTMKNNGAVTGKISTKDGTYTVPQGYHDGSGKVAIDGTEQAKIVPENIREGVTVLGITGTMTGTEDAKAQTIDVVPTNQNQVIVPDISKGYNYIAQVNVAKIPYSESNNSAGGITVTIG